MQIAVLRVRGCDEPRRPDSSTQSPLCTQLWITWVENPAERVHPLCTTWGKWQWY